MSLSDDFFVELNKILASDGMKPVMDQLVEIDRQMGVAAQRNEVQADWLSHVFDRLYSEQAVEAHKINPETGRPHTVESMVNDYKKKIGWELFEGSKTASSESGMAVEASLEDRLPLSLKKKSEDNELSEGEARQVWSRICSFIDAILKSHNGYVDSPAIFDEIRAAFNLSIDPDLPGMVKEEIERRKQKYFGDKAFNDGLPEIPLSEPRKIGDDQASDSDNNMFSNIGVSGPAVK